MMRLFAVENFVDRIRSLPTPRQPLLCERHVLSSKETELSLVSAISEYVYNTRTSIVSCYLLSRNIVPPTFVAEEISHRIGLGNLNMDDNFDYKVYLNILFFVLLSTKTVIHAVQHIIHIHTIFFDITLHRIFKLPCRHVQVSKRFGFELRASACQPFVHTTRKFRGQINDRRKSVCMHIRGKSPQMNYNGVQEIIECQTNQGVIDLTDLVAIHTGGLENFEFEDKIVRRINQWIQKNKCDPTQVFKIIEETESITNRYSFLGLLTTHGIGTSKDLTRAFIYFNEAAHAGEKLAEIIVGWCFENAHGVDQDYFQAFQWYRKAASAGCPVGLKFLGWCYEQGIWIERNYKRAFQLYKKSIEAGYIEANYDLGRMYYLGDGMRQNLYKGFLCFRNCKAHSHRTWMLGNCYYEGIATNRDIHEAIKMFRKAHFWPSMNLRTIFARLKG
ncbi:hypothetical protein G9A89_001582 [Geosiphon pyriformis]|nr:hypothetical protein G9A89_001582 [Geosiphon pyriformis]